MSELAVRGYGDGLALLPQEPAVARVSGKGAKAGVAAVPDGGAYQVLLSAVAKQRSISNSADQPTGSRGEILRLQINAATIKEHEDAHLRAGGGYAGGISFLYQEGPDRQQYVSGGEVSVSVPVGSTPEEAIRNMRTVKQAALAPTDPSPQDLRVVLQAAAIAARMQAKINARQNGDNSVNDFPHSIAELITSLAPQKIDFVPKDVSLLYQQHQEWSEGELSTLQASA